MHLAIDASVHKSDALELQVTSREHIAFARELVFEAGRRTMRIVPSKAKLKHTISTPADCRVQHSGLSSGRGVLTVTACRKSSCGLEI